MTSSTRLILASASPRRQSLLREAGFSFVLHPADVDESNYPQSLMPDAVAELLADRKLQAVSPRYPMDVTLAADTVAALGAQTLGKAADAADAKRILRSLAGTHHETITAVRVGCPARGISLARTVRSSVFMRPLSEAELDAYIATGLWEGKAGAYGIQDQDPFVLRTEGSLTNIMGLPMDEVRQLLASAGVVPTV